MRRCESSSHLLDLPSPAADNLSRLIDQATARAGQPGTTGKEGKEERDEERKRSVKPPGDVRETAPGSLTKNT